MPPGKEFRSRLMATNPVFNYLPDGDRYLLTVEPPSHRFNIIGTGINGCEHIRITMMEGRATVHGVYDPNPGSLEKAKQIYANFAPADDLVIYDSLEAACNDPAVDGLMISTPNYTHIDVVRVAAQSGKHIFLEKPMATTLQDAYEIAQLANNYSAIFQIGLQYRYKAMCVEAVHELLARKTVGQIKTISISEHRLPFLDKVNQWNKFSKYSGGTLVEKCCHYFDLFNLFAQSKPKSVYATGSMAVNFREFEYQGQKSDILDNAFVIVTYENGIQANFSLCMFAPTSYEEIIVCGDEGRLKAVENGTLLAGGASESSLEINCGLDRPSRKSSPSYPAFIEKSGHGGATYFEQVYFVDNIEGKTTSTATAEEGFWSVVIGVAAEESVKTGQIVQIDSLLQKQGIKV